VSATHLLAGGPRPLAGGPRPLAGAARSIIDAATELFAEHGFDAISVASIAKRAGVCKANVFHHFPSKEELYLAVSKEASAEHADYVEALLRAPGNSADKVRKLTYFHITNLLDNSQRTRLLLREISDPGHARVRKLARAVFQRNFTAVVNIFEQGRESGEFRASIDPAAAAMIVSGAAQCFFSCRGAVHEFREATGLENPQTYAERVADLLLAGVVRAAK
jgi:TetR/AcrR family transcriptional regulator